MPKVDPPARRQMLSVSLRDTVRIGKVFASAGHAVIRVISIAAQSRSRECIHEFISCLRRREQPEGNSAVIFIGASSGNAAGEKQSERVAQMEPAVSLCRYPSNHQSDRSATG